MVYTILYIGLYNICIIEFNILVNVQYMIVPLFNSINLGKEERDHSKNNPKYSVKGGLHSSTRITIEVQNVPSEFIPLYKIGIS